MPDEDFDAKKHLTRHLTLGRYGVLEEASEVNSPEEFDYLNWKEYLARTLDPELNVTPYILKQIVLATEKYRRAFRSVRYGTARMLQRHWAIVFIILVIGITLFLYFTGYINV